MQCVEQTAFYELSVLDTQCRGAKCHRLRLEEVEIAVLARVLGKVGQEVCVIQHRAAVVGKGIGDVGLSHGSEVMQRGEKLECEEAVLRHGGHVAEQAAAFGVGIRGGIDTADVCREAGESLLGDVRNVAPRGQQGGWRHGAHSGSGVDDVRVRLDSGRDDGRGRNHAGGNSGNPPK